MKTELLLNPEITKIMIVLGTCAFWCNSLNEWCFFSPLQQVAPDFLSLIPPLKTRLYCQPWCHPRRRGTTFGLLSSLPLLLLFCRPSHLSAPDLGVWSAVSWGTYEKQWHKPDSPADLSRLYCCKTPAISPLPLLSSASHSLLYFFLYFEKKKVDGIQSCFSQQPSLATVLSNLT